MSLTTFIRAVAVATLAVAAWFNPTGASAAPSASPMIVTPYESLSFSAKQPGNPQIAPVKGQPEREASSIVMKMGRGAFPMHTHTANYQLVVIKGVMKHWDAKGSQKAAPKMGPGSFWYQPAGLAHGDACESDECVWFITFDGPRDFEAAASAQ
ncbi:DUF4437 domain-containing protein [Ideonella paludis]|uniref:DUF4437 domain-containing protein n=1 Tax=Ideonella paludis TaxID=1233411 RepID=A0ABS5DTS7_9BURK|nr:DUF4437 domain-containing protein [Ideonella paludis]MBQ0934515.1 DUF4437 domain-containing protein [Ideonella paludis]